MQIRDQISRLVPRPTREEMFLQIADVVSRRGTCSRLKVGAIVTDWDGTRIISMGYNGNARGLPNHCDREEAGNCGCLHAEENALLKIRTDIGPLVMYCTHSPCEYCAKRILQTNIKRVYFVHRYRNPAGLELLQAGGVQWIHHPEI